jgi:GT2 family glycosyltransferase
MVPGTLVVLFNPTEKHVANLLRLRQLCAHLIAIDNSLHFDSQLHARIESAGIEIMANFNRGGVAGAYNRGLERLSENGAQLLLIFDQDSEVADDYFTLMLEACGKIDSPYFLVGPKILDVNVNRYMPAHVVAKFGFRPVSLIDRDCGLLPCSSIISSGSAMSTETYRRLGPFMEDYVIDQVDTEFCFRAVCQGISIYINTALTLKHQISNRIDHRILFLKLIEWNMAPLRQYYSARNCIHVFRRYGMQFPVLILINIITIQQILSITLFERDKSRKFLAMLAGIIDGLRSRYGSFESCRPRLSVFCTRPSP